jgi:hypothetical protein
MVDSRNEKTILSRRLRIQSALTGGEECKNQRESMKTPESKYDGLITYEYQPSVFPDWVDKVPRDPTAVLPVMWVDGKVIPGAFYFDAVMIVKPTLEGSFNDPPMIHEDWDEVLAFFGTNSADPGSLGGVVEFTLGDELHTFTKSCAIFLPRGLQHGPLIFKKVSTPILLVATGNCREPTQTLPEGWDRLLR